MIGCILEGGLGNNLFQIAATIAHSLKHELDYGIPTVINNPHFPKQKPYYSPNIKYSDDVLTLPIYKEKDFTYSEIPPVDNICLSGYFQSYKYFDDYRDEILQALNFKWKKKKDYCSIHIRLGDFMDKPDCHPPVTQAYIFEAMMSVMSMVHDWEAVKFIVFSDSMKMAKEMLDSSQFKSFPIEYSEGRDEIEDLELMSSCEHNILSNSAYSWWGHYLNRNPKKIGIFPINWFGYGLQNDIKDLHFPGTLLL